MDNQSLIVSQIRQRLEILWNLVDELEGGGGGGGTSDYSDLSNKPQINSTTLEGNKTAAQLGLATSTAVSGLTERFNDLFALDNVNLQTDDEYPTTLDGLLALHEPVNINNVNYYFFEESGIDYNYFAIDTSGAYPKISYIQFLKDSHRVVFYEFETDTVPTASSGNFITSGGVKTALDSKVNTTTISPSAWTAVTVHANSVNDVAAIQTGGYVKIGKLVTASIRFKVKANEVDPAVTHKISPGWAVLQGLPAPVSTMSGTGNSCVAVSSNIGGNWALTSDGNILYLSTNGSAIPADTMVIVSCTYLCV